MDTFEYGIHEWATKRTLYIIDITPAGKSKKNATPAPIHSLCFL